MVFPTNRTTHKWFLLLFLAWCFGPSNILVMAAAKQSSTSLYDRLGVSPKCSAKELTKAYRKACLKHHPDKGGDEEEFKELCKAYEILNDPEKRQMYDRYGEAGVNHPGASGGGGGGGAGFGGHPQQGTRQSFHFHPGTAGGNFNPEDLFRQFSQQQQQQQAPNGGFFGNGFQSFSQGDGDVNLDHIFQEFMMRGSGARFGGGGGFGGFTSPPSAGGGFTTKPQQQQPRVFERPLPCSLEELATGKVKKIKLKMPQSQHHQTRIIQVHLQKGWKAGTKIKYAATRDFPAVTLIVREKPHPYLERRGNDLVYKVSHAQGASVVKIVLPDGEIWERRLPKTLRRGEQLTIADKGMPIKGGPARGNLILEIT